MNIYTLVLIGIGLSIDSLAASITTGACSKGISFKTTFKVASFMAVFQGILPLLGWLIGNSFKTLIENYDHWVAFILLFGIGVKLIYESYTKEDDCKKSQIESNNLLLAGVALATSIDALIMGIGFGVVEVNIWLAMIIIGTTTFMFSSLGIYVGEKLGNKINTGIEIFGGLVLIGLGIKILLEHIFF